MIVSDAKAGCLPAKRRWTFCVGNIIEHYDTALFGFLSPYLAPLLFPEERPVTALFFVYVIMSISRIVNPVGALFFGVAGDLFGKRKVLAVTLVGMGIVSAGMGCIPTYVRVGLWSPLLFFLGRLLQNFFMSGEAVGGAVMLLEEGGGAGLGGRFRFPVSSDLLSGLYQSSTIVGNIVAAFALSGVIAYGRAQGSEGVDPGWRFLYFVGGAAAVVGYLLRGRGCATREKSRSVSTYEEGKNRVCAFFSHGKEIFALRRKELFIIAINMGFSYASYVITFHLMNGFIPLITPFSKAQMIRIHAWLLLFDGLTLPLFGYVASKIGRNSFMCGVASISFLAIPLTVILPGASLLSIILIRLFFTVSGAAFAAPLYSWAVSLVPKTHRYGTVALGNALGVQLLGAPTAAISLRLYEKTGIVSSISWYWVALGAVAFVCMKKRFARVSHAL
ncbi:MAG: MFS transporter [Simkaniaceae bacterium]|nr:MFS transporter [Simkaniaceae bacterium]